MTNTWYNPPVGEPTTFGGPTGVVVSEPTYTYPPAPTPAPPLSYGECLRIGTAALRQQMEATTQSYEGMVGSILRGLHEMGALQFGPEQEPVYVWQAGQDGAA